MTVRPLSGRSKGHADLLGKVAKASPISFRGFLGLREQPIARFHAQLRSKYAVNLVASEMRYLG